MIYLGLLSYHLDFEKFILRHWHICVICTLENLWQFQISWKISQFLFFSKDRRDSGDDHRSSPASSSTSNVAIAAAAAAAAAAAQFNATVSTSEASSDRGTPPRGKHTLFWILATTYFTSPIIVPKLLSKYMYEHAM